MSRLKEFMAKEHASSPFSQDEIDAALEKMSDANQIMAADEMIFLI